VDKFEVPDDARDEFWTQVRLTHTVLRRQAGFLGDVLLEKDSGPARFNVVTMVKWSRPTTWDRPGPPWNRRTEPQSSSPPSS
jgi:hypothetical protein